MVWECFQFKDFYNDGKIGMYIDGLWGCGQYNESINEIIVLILYGFQGDNGIILIIDFIVVFKGFGYEELVYELVGMLIIGES